MMPTLWLLGLSGSGKTMLGSLLRLHLEAKGLPVEFIDSDAFMEKRGLSESDPEARVRCINAVRDHVLDMHAQGKICIVAAVTPYAEMRRKNREQIPLYREVWVRCSLETLVARDPKGLYARAACEEVPGLCGLTDAFDEPMHADCIIDTDSLCPAAGYEKLRDCCLAALEEGENFQHWAGQATLPALPEVRADAGGYVRALL